VGGNKRRGKKVESREKSGRREEKREKKKKLGTANWFFPRRFFEVAILTPQNYLFIYF
jgi:hypothetical protein